MTFNKPAYAGMGTLNLSKKNMVKKLNYCLRALFHYIKLEQIYIWRFLSKERYVWF